MVLTPVLLSVLAPSIGMGQDLSSLKAIQVGTMGHTDDAERFRMIAEEQLSKKGFSIVDVPERAEAILTGVITIQNSADGSSTEFTTVVLKGKDGVRLWSNDYCLWRPYSSIVKVDGVRFRAEVLANDIQRACKKARRK
jgi:hypothetical protein